MPPVLLFHTISASLRFNTLAVTSFLLWPTLGPHGSFKYGCIYHPLFGKVLSIKYYSCVTQVQLATTDTISLFILWPTFGPQNSIN